MKTKNYVLALGAAALLFAATPVLAHEDERNARAAFSVRAGATLDGWKEHKDEWKEWRREWKERAAQSRSHVVAGKVTAVSDSTITIDPRGKASTTTITTNSDTVIKLNGEIVDADHITVGAKVVAYGTTTATSDDGDAFSASIVAAFTKGLGHLKHWFWLR